MDDNGPWYKNFPLNNRVQNNQAQKIQEEEIHSHVCPQCGIDDQELYPLECGCLYCNDCLQKLLVKI